MRTPSILCAIAYFAFLVALGCSPEPVTGGAPAKSPDATAVKDASAATNNDHEQEIAERDGDEDADDSGVEAEEGDGVNEVTTKVTAKKTSAPKPAPMELTVYRNAAGQLICPVMDVPIESEEKAFSFADYKGKRYYFCCDGCPKVFENNKDTYAK
jgi:YHS domain-containing protein